MNNQVRYVRSPFLKNSNFKNPNLFFNYFNHRYYLFRQEERKLFEIFIPPITIAELSDKVGERIVNGWIENHLIFNEKEVWSANHITHLEIETSTVCNWNCVFCPNSFTQRPVKWMDMKLFSNIIDKAKAYKKIQYITLHAYNEPTINPMFFEQVKIISEAGFRLILYTNGSGLDQDLLQFLKQSGCVRNIVFNIPSTNNKTFIHMTRYYKPDYIKDIIKKSISMGFHTTLSIQGYGESQKVEADNAKRFFPQAQILAVPSFDRGGLIKNDFYRGIYINDEFLFGCGFMLSVLHIGVNGECFLCLEDFNKNYWWDNIRNQSIEDLLNSHRYIHYKKMIWGKIAAAENFICRKCAVMLNVKSF